MYMIKMPFYLQLRHRSNPAWPDLQGSPVWEEHTEVQHIEVFGPERQGIRPCYAQGVADQQL